MDIATCTALYDLNNIATRAKAWRAELIAHDNIRSLGTQTLDVVQRELEAVIENIDYGVFVMGPDFRTRIINSTFQNMWSLPDEFVEHGTDFFETIEYLRQAGMYDVPDSKWPAYVRTRFKDVLAADGSPHESRRRDGRVLLYKCLPLPAGGRMLTYFDITDQKNVEAQLKYSSQSLEQRIDELEILREELRTQRDVALQSAQAAKENEELLSEAIENIDRAVLVWDKNGRLIASNQRVNNILPDLADQFHLEQSFGEVIKTGVSRGVFSLPEGRSIDAFAGDRWSLQATGRHEECIRLDDGRWLRINRRRTPLGKRIETISDITEEKKSEANLKALAAVDPLTELANRRAFDEEIALLEFRAMYRQPAPPVGVLLIDLDEFKEVNDNHGHPVGDEVLKIAAKRIACSIRDNDMAARIGGDEFAVILRNAPSLSSLRQTANRILHAMSAPVTTAGRSITCTFSIGGAHWNKDFCDVGEFISVADRALYAAKKSGRNRAIMHTEPA